MKKLKQKIGESIAETLVAVLILSLSFLMLTGAVVTAARLNHRAQNADVAFVSASSGETRNVTVSLDGVAADVEVTVHQTENGYYYYEATA